MSGSVVMDIADADDDGEVVALGMTVAADGDIAIGGPVSSSSSSAHLQGKHHKEVKDMSSLPWVEKYRPSSVDQIIAHEEIVNILTRLIDNNQLPHLLFHGPPGTGK
jgi:hypothetical protein